MVCLKRHANELKQGDDPFGLVSNSELGIDGARKNGRARGRRASPSRVRFILRPLILPSSCYAGENVGVVNFHCMQMSLVMSVRFIFGDG